MELLHLWKAVELFNGLSDSQLQQIVDLSQEETFHDGDIIFEQGAAGDKLYFISDGQVEILTRQTPDAPQRSQVYLGRGQVFGEVALVDFGPRSATVRCCRDYTSLRAIRGTEFTELCRQDTAIGYTVMRNMALDLCFKLRHRNLDPGAGSR